MHHTRINQGASKSVTNPSKSQNPASTALAAVALQDHIMRNLSLGDPCRPRRPPIGYAKSKVKKEVRSVIDTGRRKPNKRTAEEGEKEYVLDERPPPPTLAQKLGLVEGPRNSALSETEWQNVKKQSNNREDSKQPCVICKDDFGTSEQVLLSCSHVFHKNCLQAFERFTGKKTCPMCRKEQYQTRVIHEGARHHRVASATKIQAHWRGYVVRCWYKKLRETVPPKDPNLRKKFYEQKLSSITDRMLSSIDHNINAFMNEIDRSLEASRDIFRQLDKASEEISEEEWQSISHKAVQRADVDCPICLTALVKDSVCAPSVDNHQAEIIKKTHITKNRLTKSTGKSVHKNPRVEQLTKKQSRADEDSVNLSSKRHASALLSCSHVFHQTCLEAFEEFAVGERRFLCPVCRSPYQKKIMPSGLI